MLRLSVIFSFLFLMSCTSTRQQAALPADNGGNTSVFWQNATASTIVLENINPWMSLQTQLSLLPGLTRSGEQVVLRGGRTPLYVVDEVIVANFEEANRMVWTPEIERISFLRGASAVVYGPGGQRGVVLIETKWINDDEEEEASK